MNTDSGRGRRKRGRIVRYVIALRVVAGLDVYVDIVDAGQLVMYTGYKHQAGQRMEGRP